MAKMGSESRTGITTPHLPGIIWNT